VTPSEPSDLPADPAELADLALAIAVEAAEMVRTRRRDGFGVATKATETDMVTDVDRASDELIRELLISARPDDGLMTEEDAERPGSSGVVWIADPIDGTTNFIYDHPPYAVSIAASIEGRPVAGAVVEISSGDRYRGSLGAGSQCNGSALRIGSPPPLARALIGTGFGYDPQRRRAQAEVMARIIGGVRDVRRLGAAAYDLCSIAAGRIDAYYEHGLKAWDFRAGEIIAAEAGAAVESLSGGPAEAGGCVLAAHPQLIGPLRELLLDAGAGDLQVGPGPEPAHEG
jgi:myo-inositol-1(or 4)-monophosphatase